MAENSPLRELRHYLHATDVSELQCLSVFP